MNLKKGDIVKGKYSGRTYTGKVYSVKKEKGWGYNEATIKRDDGEEGTGKNIKGYGKGWLIFQNNGENEKWGADGYRGTLIKIDKKDLKRDMGIEISLPPEIKELLIKNMALLIRRKYLTHKFRITAKGKKKLVEILKGFTS